MNLDECIVIGSKLTGDSRPRLRQDEARLNPIPCAYSEGSNRRSTSESAMTMIPKLQSSKMDGPSSFAPHQGFLSCQELEEECNKTPIIIARMRERRSSIRQMRRDRSRSRNRNISWCRVQPSSDAQEANSPLQIMGSQGTLPRRPVLKHRDSMPGTLTATGRSPPQRRKSLSVKATKGNSEEQRRETSRPMKCSNSSLHSTSDLPELLRRYPATASAYHAWWSRNRILPTPGS